LGAGANAVAVQSDGKGVLVGSGLLGLSSGSPFDIARLNVDGQLDSGFGVGGKESFTVTNGE
jgi:hypothetical protein